MPSVHIKITNLAAVRSAFSAAPRLMSKELGNAIKKATFLVDARSKINTPVDTGRLRASHRTMFQGVGQQFAGIVQPVANYAMFVHEGTKFMQGRPFLRTALEDSENEIQYLFRTATQNALNSIGRMV